MLNKYKKIDYKNQKNYENPYYKTEKVKKGKINWLNLGIFLTITTSIFLFYWLTYHTNYIKITNIKVNEGELSVEVKKFIDEYINKQPKYRQNILFFNCENLKTELTNSYYLNNIICKKNLINKLIINFETRTVFAVWLEKNNYWEIDKNGWIVKNINSHISTSSLLIENQGNEKVLNDHIEYPNANIEFINKIYEKFTINNTQNIKIKKILIENEIQTIKMVTDKDKIFIFNTANSAEEQLDNLIILINQKLKEKYGQITYIDLRFGDKIYYK